MTNVRNALEIGIEPDSLKDDDGNCRVEHYPASPDIDLQGKCETGLANNLYFANATTDLTAYSLEHYDEVKDIIDCHLICKKTCKYYNEDTSGNIYTKSFEVRIQTIENYVGKLISPMPHTLL